MPGDQVPEIDFWDIDLTDKFAHFAVFGLLAVLMVRAEQVRNRTTRLTIGHQLVIILVCTLLGILIEAVQGGFIPTRYASVGDVVADGLGAVLGTVFAPWLLKLTGLHYR